MHFVSRNFFATLLVVLAATLAGQAQSSAQLHAKYGEPQMKELKNNRVVVERFFVRPNIQMTIRYTDLGEPCEAIFEPVPDSTPKTGRPEHAPDRNYMSTAELITVINEILPIESRGKKGNEFFVNGGDPAMKLHHPGCTGYYAVDFENASLSAASWCWGGTFSATIHWRKRSCHDKRENQLPAPNKSCY